MENENNSPQQEEAKNKPSKIKAFFNKPFFMKIRTFYKKIFKNKVFWICLSVVILALIIVWCTLAPGKSDKSSPFTIGYSIARFVGLFIMIGLGLLLGRITIKGVSFGTAGVFLVALAIGAAFASVDKNIPFIGQFVLEEPDIEIYSGALQNLGLILFASAVGFIAGPTFFRSFKSNAKSFITMGVSVTVVGILLTALIALIPGIDKYYASGIFSGAITSTPALAAAEEAAIAAGADTTMITIGYAITYPLGVLGVVLFIQLMPKILKADMSMERGRLIIGALKEEMREEKIEEEKQRQGLEKTYFEVDSFGITPFAIAVVCGLLIGVISIPLTPSGYAGPCFSLGTTGGCLLSCITFAHFGHVGKMSFKVPTNVNKTFREFGLAVFLAGIGVVGGFKLINEITHPKGAVTINGSIIAIGIALGLVITIVPMVSGYFMGKYLFKLPLLNNLGAITGSMTSTPALGALIGMAKTDDVANAYAAAFPIATILTAIGMNLYLTLA